MKDVRVNRKGAGRIASGHPWIFSSDILDRGGAGPGAAVRVLDPAGRALGTAHYSDASQIALRMLSAQVEEIGDAFFARRIAAAQSYRDRVISDTDAYRLVYGEADHLPALIIDRYAGCFSVQLLSQGMDCARDAVLAALPPGPVVLRNDAGVRSKERLPSEIAVARGEVPAAVKIRMNGLHLEADLLRGQKTGIYLDQRENYLAAARYASGRALDCFSSTGGFALHMAARCESVQAIDSSAPALAIAARNAEANGVANVQFRQADVFEFLAGCRREFDIIVLDPPAFAKSRRDVDDAARGYREINRRALGLLAPGGVLVTCSCSHHVSEALLLQVVAEAALDAGRTLRVIERRTQSRDHPILLTVPETHYLKCLILHAM